jgi:3-deoxy-manno-octulosonate cytidylyltransferase (CMP-KDO synthetase)
MGSAKIPQEHGMKKDCVWAVLPARYASTRFPRKMLADLKGKPLIQRTWERVKQAQNIDRVTIATDHEEIYQAARSFGAEVVMTDPALPSGTDRIAVVTKEQEEGWILNVQGDEPMIQPRVLDEFISSLQQTTAPMATLARRITSIDDISNPNMVKVVLDLSGKALYFSRFPIPFDRDGGGSATYWHHLGIYAYRPATLQQLVKWPPSPLEIAEKLEQLRALQNGVAIQVTPTSVETVGVDSPADLEKVSQLIND